jgi:hypothetical protein
LILPVISSSHILSEHGSRNTTIVSIEAAPPSGRQPTSSQVCTIG